MEVKPYIPTFKCLLLGDSKVGKTSYIRRHLTGDFTKNYTTTVGAEIHSIPFNSNNGTVVFNVWDAKDIYSQCGIREGIYQYTQCAIILFDVKSHVSYKNVSKWYANILKYCGNIPVSLCGNKVDAKSRSVHPKDISFHYDKYMSYFEISAKCNYNFEKPFLWLATELLNDKTLSFIVLPKLAPAEVKLDVPFQLKREEEIRNAQRIFRMQAVKEPPKPRPVEKGTQNSLDHLVSSTSSRLLDKKRKASLMTIIGPRKSISRVDDPKSLARSPSLRYSRDTLQVWLNTASFSSVYKKPSLTTKSIASVSDSTKLKRKGSITGNRASTAQTNLRLQRIESQSEASKDEHSHV